MLTEFGKTLRKMRIERNEILKDMADKLAMTSSYLSAIECGKRNIPINFITKLAETYQLTNDEIADLHKAEDVSRECVKINLSGNESQKRDLALQFARKFDDIDEETAKTILRFLNKGE